MQDLQVVEQNNEFYVDSREVAEMVGKRHDHLIRDIKGYIEVLEENPNLGTRQFLKRVLTLQIKTKFNLATYSQKGCDMVANKMTGSKGVLFTAMYVEAFHKMDEHIKQAQLNVPQTPMQALEMMFNVQKTKNSSTKK